MSFKGQGDYVRSCLIFSFYFYLWYRVSATLFWNVNGRGTVESEVCTRFSGGVSTMFWNMSGMDIVELLVEKLRGMYTALPLVVTPILNCPSLTMWHFCCFHRQTDASTFKHGDWNRHSHELCCQHFLCDGLPFWACCCSIWNGFYRLTLHPGLTPHSRVQQKPKLENHLHPSFYLSESQDQLRHTSLAFCHQMQVIVNTHVLPNCHSDLSWQDLLSKCGHTWEHLLHLQSIVVHKLSLVCDQLTEPQHCHLYKYSPRITNLGNQQTVPQQDNCSSFLARSRHDNLGLIVFCFQPILVCLPAGLSYSWHGVTIRFKMLHQVIKKVHLYIHCCSWTIISIKHSKECDHLAINIWDLGIKKILHRSHLPMQSLKPKTELQNFTWMS